MMADRHISPWSLPLVALISLMLPLQWLIAMILAILIHEGCHYLMIRICGGVLREVRITPCGICMEVEDLGRWKELVCAMAGPIGGLLLLPLAPWIPRTATCAFAQSLFNLLPVYPLDGGRALRCGVDLILPPRAAKWVRIIVEWGCISGLFLLGVYGSFFLRLGLLPLMLSGSVVLRSVRGKIPCNAGTFSLQ